MDIISFRFCQQLSLSCSFYDAAAPSPCRRPSRRFSLRIFHFFMCVLACPTAAGVGALAVGAAVAVLAAAGVALKYSAKLQDATGLTAFNSQFKMEYGSIPLVQPSSGNDSE
jgi:hypothetical protein